ncbi:cell wall metabolism sensor histidine kinase WalK [Gloeocapsa sp. PCC 73106]|uniref:sensor histidine kinase n=1 Tax=Gloeocapsa sp. PCC 73106 TaxID=102232 RepID=UPI0002AC9830|nr:HAMP domain-containing sensor histidine kinase [Gloeocapsa sp. PCC 73106]ELS00164.1 histidine kinase,HAMP domain-containing protein,histidine kinase [Gloeocapsa sp. PCC 73106]
MKWSPRLLQKLNSWIDTESLRVRMTLGIATVSALGLGSLASWIGLKMQHILISSHKQTLEYIAERFPRDLEIYTEMVPLPTGTKKAINNLTNENTWLWVVGNDGMIIAQSDNLNPQLLSLKDVASIPRIHAIAQGHWLICAIPVEINGVKQGVAYIAQDITGDQRMFLQLMKNLSLATVLGISLMTVAIATYIRRSLQPLKAISQATAKIEAEELSKVRFELEKAPTEVKELAQTFDEMVMRLSLAWEHQRELVSNVSHELRTPLTIVSGYLQSTLRRGNNLTPVQREALEIAHSEANRTIQLMQDLLELARADNGRMHFQLEELALPTIVTETVEMGRRYSHREINLDIQNEELVIKADRSRLKQVLLNLIDNAVKYSEESVTVKVWREENQGKIQISDRGIGITLAQQSRVFERFYRVDEARSRSSGGTGLGLAIVKTFVEGMKGDIFLASQPGKGTDFTVCFPLLEK